MGIFGFYLFFALIGNGTSSLLIILKEKMGDSIWKIALGALAVATLGVGWLFVREWQGEPVEISGVLTGTFWAWYFVFVPQLLIFLILRRKKANGTGTRRIRIAWRIALTLFFPIALSCVHWIIGIRVLHITPD